MVQKVAGVMEKDQDARLSDTRLQTGFVSMGVHSWLLFAESLALGGSLLGAWETALGGQSALPV